MTPRFNPKHGGWLGVVYNISKFLAIMRLKVFTAQLLDNFILFGKTNHIT